MYSSSCHLSLHCRGQLSRVSEQLACQHVKVLRIQQSEGTTEQICAERIAEQQLRIKQVLWQYINQAAITET